MVRHLTAAVFLPPFVALVWAAPPLYFALLVAAAAGAASWELHRLLRAGGWPGSPLAGAVGGAALVALAYGWPAGGPNWGLVLALPAALLVSLGAGAAPRERLLGFALGLWGLLAVGWTLAHLAPLRALPQGRSLVLFLCLAVWGGDTGAFYAGRLLGRRPLAPLLSPRKTAEGALGGLLASALGGALGAWAFGLWGAGAGALLGLGLGALGQLGDLAESLLKRAAGVKESGSLVPGHGGTLDRVDSLLFAAPAFYHVARWLLP
ncbi:MAG: phosphatidate cytidylyltransferase [Nitrospinota bacterium]